METSQLPHATSYIVTSLPNETEIGINEGFLMKIMVGVEIVQQAMKSK